MHTVEQVGGEVWRCVDPGAAGLAEERAVPGDQRLRNLDTRAGGTVTVLRLAQSAPLIAGLRTLEKRRFSSGVAPLAAAFRSARSVLFITDASST